MTQVQAQMNRHELATRHGVTASAVYRALATATARHQKTGTPPPPEPVNPGAAQPRFDVDEFDSWWSMRPTRGRPPAEMEHIGKGQS